MPKIGILHSGTEPKVRDYITRFKTAVETHTFGPPQYDDDATNNYGHNGRRPLTAIARRLLNDPTINLVAALGGSAAMMASLRAPNPRRTPVVVCCPNDELINAHDRSYSTGVHAGTSSLETRRMEILLQTVNAQPGDTIGVLMRHGRDGNAAVRQALDRLVADWNNQHQPANPLHPDYQEVAPAANDAATINIIAQFFQQWRAIPARGALVASDPLFHDLRANIVAIANANVRHTIYQWDDFVTAGGWKSHGANLLACYDSAGHMAGRIIMGESAANIPPIIAAAITT